MNLVDVLVVVLVVAAAFRGWRRGLLGQAFEFGGGLAGLLLGVAVGPRVASAVTDRPGLAGAMIALIAVLLGLSLGQIVGFMLGHRFGSLARRARLGPVDSAMGSLFGAAVTLVAYWLLGSLLIHGPVQEVSRALDRSEVLRAMNRVVEPPDVLAYVTQYLDTSGFPQIFVANRPTGSPVRLPESRVARAALEAAGASTVRVLVPACGGTQLGSGWVAAPGTVVTNAHVVAGGDALEVEDRAGRHDGTVVLFDPGVDLAVIKAGGLAGPVLGLDPSPREKGQPGATLGYPGGAEGLRVHRAAIQGRFPADGFDIYGTAGVRREVYELRARVRQGDSGGPFLLPSGRVGGVVFAASTTDDHIGYALTGAEVADEIRRGAVSEREVDTGGCTH